MKESSLSGANVVITGADGFIGSHLTERLISIGANVKALILYNSWNHRGWLEDTQFEANKDYEVVYGDVTDQSFARDLVSGADYVFHLASIIEIPYSYRARQACIDTNIIGTKNILDACLENHKLRKLIHTSTSEVYGSAQFTPITEKHPLVAQSPYSATKIAADKLVESYSRSFGLPALIARPFNTFGPRQTTRAVIPTIIRQAMSSEDEIVLGTLTTKRDFVYVKDTVKGFISLASITKSDATVFNIATGNAITIANTLDHILSEISFHKTIKTNQKLVRPDASEVDVLCGDASLLTSLSEWRPDYSFNDGIKETIDWWRTRQN